MTKKTTLICEFSTLQTSKTLNYLSSPIVVPFFSFFILVWVYLRHYVNLSILYATLTTFRTVGPYEIDWAAQQYKCLLSQIITFSLLAILQGINLLWLYFIVRVAYNIVFANNSTDVRSDDEDNAEEEGGEGKQSSEGKAKEKGKKKGKKAIDGGPPAHAQAQEKINVNGGLNLNSEEKSFAEGVQQRGKKDI